MSLVSEALKKAEREAAARDARGKGQPAPFEAPLQPYRSRRRGGARTARFAAVGGVAMLAALALLWWSSRPKAPADGETSPTSAPAATSSAKSTSGSEPASPQARASDPPAAPNTPTPPILTSAAAAPPPAAPSVSEPPATPLATPPLPQTTPHAPASPPSASESAKPKPPAPRAPEAPEPVTTLGPGDYLRRVDFPDGSALELGGIVYSETSPFAYLNGRLVGVGEFVEGRRIDRIERDRVLLSGDAGAITLRLKAP